MISKGVYFCFIVPNRVYQNPLGLVMNHCLSLMERDE